MGRKIICAAVALCFMTCLAVPAFAGKSDNCSAMGKKFMRGATNTLTGWVEIISQTMKGYERGYDGYKDDKISGILGGLIAGVWHATGRTISGVADMVGFWAADPKAEEDIGIPLEAQYAWQEGTPYSLTKPNFMKATMQPIGNKFMRGSGNLLGGVIELPGQVSKGIKNHDKDAGIVKGFWYWFSREIDGAYELATFALPGPKDSVGVQFDDQWPWSAWCDSACSKKKTAAVKAAPAPVKTKSVMASPKASASPTPVKAAAPVPVVVVEETVVTETISNQQEK